MVAIIDRKLTNPKIEFWDTHGCPTQGTIETAEKSLYFRFRSNQFKVYDQKKEIHIHATDQVLFMNYYFDRNNIDEKFIRETLSNIIEWRENSEENELIEILTELDEMDETDERDERERSVEINNNNVLKEKITKNELFQFINNNDLEGDNQEELFKTIIDLELPLIDIKNCSIGEWYPVIDQNGIVDDFITAENDFLLSCKDMKEKKKCKYIIEDLCFCQKSDYYFYINEQSNIKEQLIEQQEAIEDWRAELKMP
ncbi:hypothetical protein DSAG12_02263 [Promethearchaeum syntrophicum]|uniref:Uncharacterized protein n=1 Tax=Promethearchaeum syntrophicum TaxID=2594042 RepID=A0A5B9DCF2_9ARCH|nr:hypothetical protein [Candidatus Prometheoarchaeum syntrophicum]QEE16433.1 hypothetical protein DSAG12_02263 [Candidatus Prometheoarchaeum syntrophicum]